MKDKYEIYLSINRCVISRNYELIHNPNNISFFHYIINHFKNIILRILFLNMKYQIESHI